MQAILPFPNIDPTIFSIDIGPITLALRWYALAYIAGLLLAWKLAARMVATPRLWAGKPPMTSEQIEALLTWVILGVVIGGRLGFVLFYQPGYYLRNPAEIIQVWHGGMSFHGGLLGVITAALIFGRVSHISLLSLGDTMAAATPFGLFFGRIANFINGELWGRPSHLPWAMVFPGDLAAQCPPGWVGPCSRHPSELYEAILEGLILGVLLLWLVWRRGWLKHPGQVMGMFFAGYGTARFLVELVRQPDVEFTSPTNPVGYALQFWGGGLTMGQILSLPMIALGLWLIFAARRRTG